MGPSIAIESNKLNPSHSGNTYRVIPFAILAIFDQKWHLKSLEMACDQVQTCLIFPLRWAGFPIKIGRNAQWEHLFSMYFDVFFYHLPYTFDLGMSCHSTRIELYYFDDNFCRIAQWVPPLRVIPVLGID